MTTAAPVDVSPPARPPGSELLDMAARVAGWARHGEQVEAFVARGRDTEVQVYGGEVESLSSAESAGIGIRVVANGRQGFAYAGSLADDVVAETLAEARDNAGFASADDAVGLAVPDGVPAASFDLWRDDLATYSTVDKVARALELEAEVRSGDPRIRLVESAEWGDGAYETAVATSTGIAASWRRTVCYLSAQAVAGQGGETQTGGGYSVGRGPADLDTSVAARDAVQRATRLLGATKPRSAHLTVVFEPRVTATLLGLVAGTLDGEAVAKGRSLFAERLGTSVASPLLTLAEDPTDPEAFGATAYDAEGLATRRTLLIDGGVLRAFLYNTAAARRVGAISTASAVRAGFKGTPGTGARALSLVPGTATPAQMLAQVGDGLLVQSVTGLHSGVNPVSGDFSVGAEGLMISGGSLGQPVRELTIASTLQRMLADVTSVGNDVERLPSSATGVSVAIGDMSMSGA